MGTCTDNIQAWFSGWNSEKSSARVELIGLNRVQEGSLIHKCIFVLVHYEPFLFFDY